MFSFRLIIGLSALFSFTASFKSFFLNRKSSYLFAIPPELTGQLNSKNSWDVKFIYNGEEKIINVPEDSSLLESAEKHFDDVDSSCRNGVCTTCAGKVPLILSKILKSL
jgi:hypothetical protein